MPETRQMRMPQIVATVALACTPSLVFAQSSTAKSGDASGDSTHMSSKTNKKTAKTGSMMKGDGIRKHMDKGAAMKKGGMKKSGTMDDGMMKKPE
ncbi:MAG: hypothetical protein NVS1B4_08310 [Gemmatimonadaceae bacterium]